MSNTIDSKVVEMRFDNRQFESNVQTSLSTLDKLKQSLNLSGASKGLENVQSIADRFSLSGLTGAADTVAVKFSHMQMSVQHVLNQMVSGAVSAGKRIVSALTIDPIKTGFQEYETQINAVQTILANTQSKGTTLNEVNSALDELNAYADKTIYNFTQMTRNIGTFTAAGLDLETSVKAIQGIANLAAISGSTSQQASTAMYQLSQALSSGTVRLMDWNSVVNAGMGGKVFQDAIIATAKGFDNVDKSVIKAYESGASFRELLNPKDYGDWFSSELLAETLQKFTKTGAVEYLSELSGITTGSIRQLQNLGDKVGYNTEEFNKLALSMTNGDKAMAKTITDVLSMAANAEDAATKVKTFSQLIDTTKEAIQSGWTQTWELIVGDFEEAKTLLTEISDTINAVIGKSAEARNELLKGWKDHHGREHLIDSLRNIFEIISNVVTPIKEAFREIFPPITVKQLVAFTEGLKFLTEKIKNITADSDNLKRTFKGVFALLDLGLQAIKSLWIVVKPVLGFIGKLIGYLFEGTAYLGDWIVKIDEAAKKTGFFNLVVQGIVDFVKLAAKTIKDFVSEKLKFKGFENLHKILENVQTRMSQLGNVAGGLGSVIGAIFKEIGVALKESDFGKVIQTLWNGIKNIAGGIGKVIGVVFDKLANADFSGFFDIINAISLSGIAAFLIKFVNSFADAVDAVGNFKESAIGILDSVRGCFEAYQSSLKAGTLLTIASAIAILAGSILVISLIDSEKLASSLAAIAGLMGALVGSFSLLGKIKDMPKACGAMITMSVSVLILAAALKSIADLKFGEVMTGLVGIAGLAGIMVGVMAILGNSKKTVIKGALQMVIFAGALKILASVCKDLADLDWDELAKGLIGVGALMAEVMIFMEFANLANGSMQGAASIVLLAAGIKVLASACEDFGYLDWQEIAKGLVSIGALLLEIAVFTRLTGNATNVISTAAALVIIGGAMKVFAWALKDFAAMKFEEIGRGLVAMAGSLLAVALAVKMMPKDMPYIGAGLVLVSGALVVITKVLEKMGGFSWEEIGKGLATLGGSIAILAAGLRVMTGTTTGSLALLTAAGALLVLTPVLSILGAMSWTSIAKGLVAMAGALTIIGVAGLLLQSAVPGILGLASGIALIGAGILATGQGLVLFGAGLVSVAAGFAALSLSATAIVATIETILIGVLKILPKVIRELGDIIVAWCDVITDAAPAIGEAAKAVILTIIDVLKECVPALIEGLAVIIVDCLEAGVEYAPQIVEALADWFIGIFESLTEKVPDITQSAVDLVAAIFDSIADAMKNVDKQKLIEGVDALKLLGGLFGSLSIIGMQAGSAIAGAISIGIALKALKFALEHIDAFKDGDTLEWIGGEGAELLKNIGTAIGSFVGGLTGGFMDGFTDKLPEIGKNLSEFMTNIQPFVNGAKNVKMDTVTGIGILATAIAAISGAEMIAGIAEFFDFGQSFTQLGKDLSTFMTDIQPFIDGATSITPEMLTGVQHLASMICILTSAGVIEGVASFMNGGSSLDNFGDDLPELGEKLSEFAKNLDGFNDEKVKAVTCAADAIRAMAGVSSGINGQTGFGKWLCGDNSILTFASQLPELGTHIKDFATNLGSFDDAKKDAVTCAVETIKSIAQVSKDIPNEGGWLAKIVGDNSIETFGGYLAKLGSYISQFATNLGSFDDTKKDAITCGVNAIKAMAEAAEGIPNEGGWLAAIVGDNSIDTFGSYLPKLGSYISQFATNLGSFDDTKKDAITCGVNAIKSMAEVAKEIPNEGGWLAAIVGDNSISTFGGYLPELGTNLASFATNLGTFKEASVYTIECATNAIKSLAECSNTINGQPEWAKTLFGDNSIVTFSDQLPGLGTNLASFAKNLGEFSDAQVMSISCASEAIKTMATAASVINGQPEWAKTLFGDNSIVTFSDQLPGLGTNLATFAKNLGEFSTEQVTTVKCASEAIAAMAVASEGIDGQSEWGKKLFGDNGLGAFSEELPTLGTNLSSFATNLGEFTNAQVVAIDSAVTAIKSFATLADSDLKGANKHLPDFGANMVTIATDIADFCTNMPDAETTNAAVGNLKNVITTFQSITAGDSEIILNFSDALEEVSKNGVSSFVDGFTSDKSKESVESAVEKLMDKAVDGIDSKTSDIEDAAEEAALEGAEAIEGEYNSFYNAGSYLVDGFAAGISENDYKASAKAAAMATSAKKAAEQALGIQSPSRVFYGIGDYAGQGFVNALIDATKTAYDAGFEVADYARNGLSKAVAKVSSLIDSGMEMQPTIRPVLDLSDVEAGANSINGLFSATPSVDVLTNVGRISSMMNQNGQNGNSEVVSAIDKLRKDLGNVGGTTYNVNGITYDDGSNVSNAIQELVRAAKIERRV